jgi:hypothetical protein
MKIIKAGDSSQQQKPAFWVGQTLTCPKCGCKFKLEAGDRPASAVGTTAGKARFYCPTPHCATLIEANPAESK